MATLPKSMPSKAARPFPAARSASVAEVKEHLSSLLRTVEHDRSEVIVRRRGVAVAKIVPFSEAAPSVGFGWMKDSAIELGDIVGPIGEPWDVSGE
jgi:antitoxin (DNA-binding transcriptional repressor) of toxin-antitoxin stability system